MFEWLKSKIYNTQMETTKVCWTPGGGVRAEKNGVVIYDGPISQAPATIRHALHAVARATDKAEQAMRHASEALDTIKL